MGSGAFLVASCAFLAEAYEARAGSRRRLPRERPRSARARLDPANDRRALSLRRRSQSDGGPAGAAVALAGDAGRRSAAELSRSPSAGGRQPDRCLARLARSATDRSEAPRARRRTVSLRRHDHARGAALRGAASLRAGARAQRHAGSGAPEGADALARSTSRRLCCRNGSVSPISGVRTGLRPTAPHPPRPSAHCRTRFSRDARRCLRAAVARYLENARAIAAARRFFHWELEFPEAFFDEGRHAPAGRRLRRGPRQSSLGHDPRRQRADRPPIAARARQRPRSCASLATRASTRRNRTDTPTAISCSSSARWRSRDLADVSGWCCRRAWPAITAARRCAGCSSRAAASRRWSDSTTARPCSPFIEASAFC